MAVLLCSYSYLVIDERFLCIASCFFGITTGFSTMLFRLEILFAPYSILCCFFVVVSVMYVDLHSLRCMFIRTSDLTEVAVYI